MRQFIIRKEANIQVIIANVSQLCADQIGKGKDVDVTVKSADSQRSIDQNAKLHCILADISNQVEWHGQKLPIVTWKRLTMAAWLREEGEQPQLIPALDGQGFDVIFERTSKLGVKKCSSLIEWIYAFGAEREVIWSEEIPEEWQTDNPLPLSKQAEQLCQDKRYGVWYMNEYKASYDAMVDHITQIKWDKLSYPEKCLETIIWACSVQDLSYLDFDEIGIEAFNKHISQPFSEYINNTEGA